MQNINSIHIELSETEKALPLLSSKFWGAPAMPKECFLPYYRTDDDEYFPYTFICQIRLDEVAAFDIQNQLPHKGMLYFFAKIDHYLGGDHPESIGSCISDEQDVIVYYYPDDLDTNEFEFKYPNEGDCIVPKERKITFSLDCNNETKHKLLGLPDYFPYQTWDAPFSKWQLLFQVDSDEGDDYGLNFMDCGLLYFIISPEDLKNSIFSSVRAVVSSS